MNIKNIPSMAIGAIFILGSAFVMVSIAMDYQNYTVMDFIMDDTFFRWVTKPSERLNKFWKEWLEQYPRQQEELEEARRLILTLKEAFQTGGSVESSLTVSKSEMQTYYEDLIAVIHTTRDEPSEPPNQNNKITEKKQTKA